ncbi:MAG: cysJ 2 [Chthoniobacteraceae bacterium]|nr:cysJ 2 [Chthoniobacteraceae bacterium]
MSTVCGFLPPQLARTRLRSRVTHPMNLIPFIPDNAPFSSEQRLWLNGYLAGIFSDASAHGGATSIQPALPAAPVIPLTIVFGSQTGTAEALAKKTAAEAKKRGFEPKVVCMDKIQGEELAALKHLLLITSTYGDGEPPDNAQSFWELLKADSAPALSDLQFSVLALGDTNYSGFCEFGKLCDARLEALGGRRVHARVDCDVDYEAPAKTWTDGVFLTLCGDGATEPESTPAELPVGYSKKNPFPARLLTNRLLNAPGSEKEVRHFEISLEGSGLSYEAGDALGVMPANCPDLAAALLSELGLDGEEAVMLPDGTESSMRHALLHHFDISRPSTEFLAAAAARTPDGELTALLDPAQRDALKKYLWGREIIDLLPGMTMKFTAPEFVALLKKLQPRLYSISSSPKAHPGQVHLTVAAVRYTAHGRSRKGVCSTFLADRANESTSVPVFIQTSHGFRPPEDLTRPVIMVGPGTGIAPFRAFLEERRATGATGKNWLFFGDQKEATDFLYKEELQAMVADGHLSRLDLAFSRDQAEKIYVQSRMLENAAELWSWLEAGAHFYVCGDASRMAKDVDTALHTVAETAGGLSQDSAADYIKRLKNEKRYQRDVY